MEGNATAHEEPRKQATVLVIGTGAIGSFYGGKLALAGADVSVVCRSDYETVKARGVQIKSPHGDFHFMPGRVLKSPGEYGGFPDFVLVATKVLPNSNVTELIRDVVGPDTSIVLVQNGVEIENPFAEAYPQNEIISGLAVIAVSRIRPGEVEHYDHGRLTIGRFPSGRSSKAEKLCSLIGSAGVPCEVTSNVVTARWKKLVWNASFNPISALGNADTHAIMASEESANLVRRVMEEVLLTAMAVAHELPPSLIAHNLEGTAAMKPYKTSMLLDFEAGRPMEVEAILGNAVRAARRTGIPVPHLESLYALLKLLDRKSA